MNEQTFANVRLNRSKVQLGILMLSCLLGLILLAQPSSGPVRAAPAAGESQLGASQSSDGGTFIPIDDPLGVKGTHAWGINPQGDIVGSYDDADNVRHGFLLRDGKFMTIDNPDGGDGPPGPLGNQGTTLYDINASGDITGRYIDSNNIAHSFLLRHGVFYPVDPPDAGTAPGQGTQADGINESGDIVGAYVDSDFIDHGFLRHGDTYVTINAPHPGSGRYSGTHAFGINNKREIVLFANDDHSFVLRHGRLRPLNDPRGVLGTLLEGINDNGVIVGLWVDGNNVSHGLVLCDGVFTTLDDPHAGSAPGQGGRLNKINPRGDSVGWYTDSDNIDHGFLFKPSDIERAKSACSSSTY
ncbi:MAG TPA: hypothetical protein VMG63_08260 [Terriglobia bacterium]|jgi:hypothetical protein|nr:hypothetical protein [Terriglobia bacterium]